MFYKVIFNGRVIDVLDKLIYLKWQEKHKIMVLCDENSAQAILSSDGDKIWHEETLYNVPVKGYDTVRIEKIDQYEYEKLKALNGKTEEEIFDSAVLLTMQKFLGN